MKNKSIILTREQLNRIINEAENKTVTGDKSNDNDELKSITCIEEYMPRLSPSNPKVHLEYMYRINEGLITSYDARRVVNIVRRKFNLDPDRAFNYVYESNGKYTDMIFILMYKNSDNNLIGSLKHILNTCGYFLTKDEKYYNDCILYQFEPKFGNDVTDEIMEKYKFLFHATPFVNLTKIMKIGLIPKSKSTSFFYPDRVHCMIGNHLTDEQLAALKDVQKDRARTDIQDNNQYIILRVDVKKLPKNMVFFIDPKMKDAIYTYDTIPPEAINVCGSFE